MLEVKSKYKWMVTFSNSTIKTGKNMGLVAQRTRARGYEPWCRGFESLLAHVDFELMK